MLNEAFVSTLILTYNKSKIRVKVRVKLRVGEWSLLNFLSLLYSNLLTLFETFWPV